MSLVWVSRAMMHPSNQRPFRNDVAERDHERLIELKLANERGEKLDPSDFPKVIFGAPHADERHYRVPDLFAAYGFWLVSEAAANLMRQFDLGEAQLRPVPVLMKDRQTPIGRKWFCLNFGNAKRVIMPEESERMEMGPQSRYNIPVTIADHQLAVSSDALGSPDIWVDPQLWDVFFLSETLGNALREAKLDKSFFLAKCRVIDV